MRDDNVLLRCRIHSISSDAFCLPLTRPLGLSRSSGRCLLTHHTHTHFIFCTPSSLPVSLFLFSQPHISSHSLPFLPSPQRRRLHPAHLQRLDLTPPTRSDHLLVIDSAPGSQVLAGVVLPPTVLPQIYPHHRYRCQFSFYLHHSLTALSILANCVLVPRLTRSCLSPHLTSLTYCPPDFTSAGALDATLHITLTCSSLI